MSRPVARVAMWMKKSFQVWTDSWGGWTSIMGGSFAAMAADAAQGSRDGGPTDGLNECIAARKKRGMWR